MADSAKVSQPGIPATNTENKSDIPRDATQSASVSGAGTQNVTSTSVHNKHTGNRNKTGNRKNAHRKRAGQNAKENPGGAPQGIRKRKSGSKLTSSKTGAQNKLWQPATRHKPNSAGFPGYPPFQPAVFNQFAPVDFAYNVPPHAFAQLQPLPNIPPVVPVHVPRPASKQSNKRNSKKGHRSGIPRPRQVPRSDRVSAPENNSSYLIRHYNNRGRISSRMVDSPGVTPGVLRETPMRTPCNPTPTPGHPFEGDEKFVGMDEMDFFGSNHGLIIRASHGTARKVEESSAGEDSSSDGEEEPGVQGFKLVREEEDEKHQGEVRALQSDLTKKAAYISSLEDDNQKLREKLAELEAALKVAKGEDPIHDANAGDQLGALSGQHQQGGEDCKHVEQSASVTLDS